MNPRWVLACAVAEAVGIGTAAAAARIADGLPAALALAVVVAGGLVEGTALGVAQSTVLTERLDATRRRAWVAVTVLVAGLGWAIGSAPSTLERHGSGGPAHALGLVVLGAAGIGLALGALLGGGQAAVLRHRVRHPWRWVPANALGWAVAMAVIFAGASTAEASWSLPALVLYGALTGALAGGGLGAVTGLWLETLDGPPLRHRTVLRLLVRRAAPATAGLTALEVTGAHSGRRFRLPVLCAPLGPSGLVVLPGRADRKTWWRQLASEPRVAVLDRGAWLPAVARVLEPGSLEWSVARAAYVARRPRVRVEPGPLVVVDMRPATSDPLTGPEVIDGRDQRPVGTGPHAVDAPVVPF